jgi:hypothetical protein
LETDLGNVRRRLDEAGRKAALPLAASWGEAKGLLAALDSATDKRDARLRLRAALRRVVVGAWLLVVSRGRDRFAGVQLHFVGGRQRSYLILHRPPKANKSGRTEGGWAPLSFADAHLPGDLDLRQRDHAARLEKALAALDLSGMEESLRAHDGV